MVVLLQLALFCVQNVSPALSQLIERHFCCSPPLVSSSVWLLLSVMKKRVTDKVRLALCQWLVVDWTCHISCLFLGVVVVEDGGGVGWL